MATLRNITITVEEHVARWARVWAARHNTSVSRLLGEMLKVRMHEDEGYEAAMREYLSIKPTRLKRAGSYPARGALHDRHDLR